MIGVAHQRKIRDSRSVSERPPIGVVLPVAMEDASLCEVSYSTAKEVILDYEYLGTMPSGFRCAYGIYWSGACAGVVVFGSPNPMQIAKSLFGGPWQDAVMQIHRGACVWWAHPHSASRLIGFALRELGKQKRWRAVVAFSDPDAGEIGTVYQATNFLYCGLTAKRPDYFTESGRRCVGHFNTAGLVKRDRVRKRRYVHLMRRFRKESMASLKWPVRPYDKRASE